MPDVPLITLNNGVQIPQLGFGVFQVEPHETSDAVTRAFEAGYRHIDTAALYNNEQEVGAAIKASGLAREELFITTKLGNGDQGYDSTLRAFDKSIGLLGLDVVDLYLIHWPRPAADLFIDTWRAFEKLYGEGRIRAIGVSNFQPEHLARLAAASDVVPAINQIELHPYLTNEQVAAYDTEQGIVTEAWSPIGRGGALLLDPLLVGLGQKYGKTPAQVVLRWHLQLGYVVIPRSVTPARIVENFQLFDFELADDDLAAISELDRGTRIGPHPDKIN